MRGLLSVGIAPLSNSHLQKLPMQYHSSLHDKNLYILEDREFPDRFPSLE